MRGQACQPGAQATSSRRRAPQGRRLRAAERWAVPQPGYVCQAGRGCTAGGPSRRGRPAHRAPCKPHTPPRRPRHACCSGRLWQEEGTQQPVGGGADGPRCARWVVAAAAACLACTRSCCTSQPAAAASGGRPGRRQAAARRPQQAAAHAQAKARSRRRRAGVMWRPAGGADGTSGSKGSVLCCRSDPKANPASGLVPGAAAQSHARLA